MTALARPIGTVRAGAAREFASAVRTIMVKELRSRFRGRRAFVILTVYLGLLALIAYAAYAVVAPGARESAQFGGGTSASATIGIAVFIVLSLFQLLLVCFIAPAFTTGAISLEREKQTLDLLISTPLRPGAIVVGKLAAALAYVVLMILAAIPISAIVFMYGGATVGDLIRQQVVLLVTALGLGAIGVFWSALVKRTQAATVLTYCTMLALTVGTLMLWGFWTILASRGAVTAQRAPEQILWINPGVAIVDVVAETEAGGLGGWSSILGGILADSSGVTPVAPAPGGVVCKGDVCFQTDANGNPVGVGGAVPAPDQAQSAIGHFWPRFALSFGFLALLATVLSMRLVVPAGMRVAFRRSTSRELLAASLGATPAGAKTNEPGPMPASGTEPPGPGGPAADTAHPPGDEASPADLGPAVAPIEEQP